MTNVVGSTPVVMSNPAVRSPGNMAYSKAFRILGIIQILLGTLSIITWSYVLAFAMSEFYYDVFAFIACGIWCGIFFLVAGILATVSSEEPNNCKIIAGMVMSILAAIFAVVMLAIESIGAAIVPSLAYEYSYQSSYCSPYYQESYYNPSVYVPTCSSPYRGDQYIKSVYIPSKYVGCYTPSYYTNKTGGTGLATLHGFMAFFAFAELVIAITHSVFCCKYKSLTSSTHNTVQFIATYQQPTNQQMQVTSTAGGMPMTVTYPTPGVVPYQNYQTPIYAGQPTNMQMNQPVAGNVTPQTYMTSSGMTAPPSVTSPPTTSPPDITSSADPPSYSETKNLMEDNVL
uniref:Uncharacterized protein n=1 Tax=Ciona savignyi TaxID=51511 RepID=H2YPN0_CIOSA